MHNEKEQEMTSPVSHGEDVQGAPQGECRPRPPQLAPAPPLLRCPPG